MRRSAALLIVATLVVPSVGYAQSSQPPALDATKMGVSLDRIRRGLGPDATETTTFQDGRLRIRIDVFGVAPPVDLIPEDFSLTYGPVPNSAPTHREHIEFVTPEEFRSPAASISNVVIWAAQKLAERSKKAQCEQEIAEYRAAVLQGIAVTAPRCTQK
jgi:hypothetical protein